MADKSLSFSNHLICIHYVSLQSKFDQNLSSGCRDIEQRSSKSCMKIGHFLGKITPWRRQVGKNLMRRTGKRIYRRFWISNQIFDSIYGSRDMALSLDTTFGIFGQNLNFVDEYLENQIFAGHAVFARLSELISSTFWESFIEFWDVVFEKKSKKCHFDHIFVFYGWTRFFMDNPALSLRTTHRGLTSCKVSRKSVCGKYRNFLWPTNRLFFRYMPQLKLRNCNVLKHLASTLDFYHLSKFKIHLSIHSFNHLIICSSIHFIHTIIYSFIKSCSYSYHCN